jgi:hypothetical protein
MPEKRGRTVHEHTARTEPDTDPTPYASIFIGVGPRYFITASCFTNTPIAPAIKKSRNKAEENVLLCIPFYKIERFKNSVIKTCCAHGI